MPDAALPQLLPICGSLRESFARTGYDADGVLALLGADAHAALGRGEVTPVRRAVRDGGALATLVRLFLLGDTCPAANAAAALTPLALPAAVAAGLIEADGPVVRAALDVRPLDTGIGSRWVVSDLDAGRGPASTIVPTSPGSGRPRCRCCAPCPPRRSGRSGRCSTWAPAAASRRCTRTAMPPRSPPPTSAPGRWPWRGPPSP